jgi:CBS domain-containing protein
MKVKDLMTTDVKCCTEYNTLNSAAQMMWENDIGCIPVVDHEGRVIGLLTDRHLDERIHPGRVLERRSGDQRYVKRGLFLQAR